MVMSSSCVITNTKEFHVPMFHCCFIPVWYAVGYPSFPLFDSQVSITIYHKGASYPRDCCRSSNLKLYFTFHACHGQKTYYYIALYTWDGHRSMFRWIYIPVLCGFLLEMQDNSLCTSLYYVLIKLFERETMIMTDLWLMIAMCIDIRIYDISAGIEYDLVMDTNIYIHSIYIYSIYIYIHIITFNQQIAANSTYVNI